MAEIESVCAEWALYVVLGLTVCNLQSKRGGCGESFLLRKNTNRTSPKVANINSSSFLHRSCFFPPPPRVRESLSCLEKNTGSQLQ